MLRALAVMALSTVIATQAPIGLRAAGDPGLAQPQGMMSTRSFAPLARGTPIAVEFGEDTELNNRLLPAIARQIEVLGHPAAAGARHILAFDARVIRRASTKPKFRLHGSGGSDGVNELDMTLKFPWHDDRQPRWGTRYRLSLVLKRGGEPPLWVGSAVVELDRGDWFTVQHAMATRLLAAFGETVEERPITVY